MALAEHEPKWIQVLTIKKSHLNQNSPLAGLLFLGPLKP
jgi:hypothetical protein